MADRPDAKLRNHGVRKPGPRGVSKPGQLIIFDHNAETTLTSDEGTARIVLSVPKSALPPPVLKKIDGILYLVEPAPGLSRIFAHSLRAICRDVAGLSGVDRARLDRSLLCSIADLLEVCGEPVRNGRASTLGQIRTDALHLIDTDLIGEISPRELADRIGCSERSLFEAFRDVGMSPARYRQRKRLEQAKLAIETSSDVSITEIAYASGFQSYSHFSRSFKSTFGITPLSLRQEGSKVL